MNSRDMGLLAVGLVLIAAVFALQEEAQNGSSFVPVAISGLQNNPLIPNFSRPIIQQAPAEQQSGAQQTGQTSPSANSNQEPYAVNLPQGQGSGQTGQPSSQNGTQPPQTQQNTTQTSPPTNLTETQTPPAQPQQPSGTGFVRASGTRLTLNGQDYRFVGVNIYGVASDDDYNCGGNPDDPEEYVEEVFALLEQKHVNAVRFWAFQSFSHDNFAAIDRVVAAAKRHNIKLIPTLENQWEDCTEGNYKYSSWYSNPNATYGYPLSYRQYVESIVTRYRNETTILMWQLVNEAESKTQAGQADPQALFNFTREISGVIKGIDQNHLVNLGTMATGQPGTNDEAFIALHSLSTIDVAEGHDYNRETQPLPGYPWDGDVDELDTIAASLAASQTQLNKPFFIGEAGISDSHSNRIDLFGAKMDAAFTNGTVGYLIWDFEIGECGGYCVDPSDPLMEIFDRYN